MSVLVLLLMNFLASCSKKTQPPSEMLNSEDHFSVTTEELVKFSSIDENFRIMQGGCVTEEYAWFIVVSAEDYGNDATKECYIVQYDRLTMEEIKRSEVLKLGHANDITYMPETNELYVSQVYGNYISILDADTLESKEVKRLSYVNHAIAYEPTQEKFALASGKLGMYILAKNLVSVDYANPHDTTLVTQGICADDKYVYHVLYSSKSNEVETENMIFVVDWEGNLVSKVPIGLEGYEPENISLVGDVFYIGCNDGAGGVVFTAKLRKE